VGNLRGHARIVLRSLTPLAEKSMRIFAGGEIRIGFAGRDTV
jgi:hypothetical protein